MPEPNRLLRAARERLPSPSVPGEHASRADVADGVTRWLWETTQTRYPFDAHYVAKLERGVVRWPSAAYRAALRHVLGASDDTALGFAATTSSNSPVVPSSFTAWQSDAVVDRAVTATEQDLMPTSRRSLLATAAVLAGSALAAELTPFLWPSVAAAPRRTSTAFTVAELTSAEEFVQFVRRWRSASGSVARSTAVAQLDSHLRRLKEAPSGTAETRRAFRVGAELADIVATMAWDEAAHGAAQRYFKLAAQLAHVAGDDALAAVALASLARQCFDLDRPADGLEVVQLAQYATRRTASPRLRAVLATREAWAHAQLGDAPAFRRSVRLAEDYFSEGLRDGDAATPSVRSLDEAELMGVIGARYRDLSRHDVRHAAEAQDYIGHAIALRDPDRVRNRVFDLIGLARSHLITREPERAAELIGMALPDAVPWTSGRVGVKLRDFHREAGAFATVPAVRDVREVVAAKLAV